MAALPATFAACMPGPCPYVRCTAHLYLSVDPTTEAITLNFPGLEVWELRETCTLRAAARGGMSVKRVAKLVNLSPDRVAHIIERALGTAKQNGGADLRAASEP